LLSDPESKFIKKLGAFVQPNKWVDRACDSDWTCFAHCSTKRSHFIFEKGSGKLIDIALGVKPANECVILCGGTDHCSLQSVQLRCVPQEAPQMRGRARVRRHGKARGWGPVRFMLTRREESAGSEIYLSGLRSFVYTWGIII